MEVVQGPCEATSSPSVASRPNWRHASAPQREAQVDDLQVAQDVPGERMMRLCVLSELPNQLPAGL